MTTAIVIVIVKNMVIHLQKLSESIKDHIAKHHPEIKLHNNNEIEQMAVCVKNSDDIVVDPLHLTNPIMTKFEYTRILGIRTTN